MKRATLYLLALAAGVLSIPAPAAINATSAPKLTLTCLDMTTNTDNSVDLVCKVQNTSTSSGGAAPVIRTVTLLFAANLVANIPDLSPGDIGRAAIHFPPNTYRAAVGSIFAAEGVANDAIFGDINSLIFPGTLGQFVASNSLQITDPQQPPQFFTLAPCTYEATPSFFPLNFPAAGGTGTLVVDTQAHAAGAPAGCPWTVGSHDGAVNIVTFPTHGATQFGPGTAAFTVLPNTVVNGNTNPRLIAMPETVIAPVTPNAVDVIAGNAGVPAYHGSFQFTQDGLTCAYQATGFTAPLGGIPSASPGIVTITTTDPNCRWQVTSASGFTIVGGVPGRVVTGNGAFQYSVAPNGSPAPINLNFSLGTALVVTAVQPTKPAMIPVTIQTNPWGLPVMVDGVNRNVGSTFQWIAGSPHTIGVSPQETLRSAWVPGGLYQFVSWSQGGPITQTVSPTAATTYTANFAVASASAHANSVTSNRAPLTVRIHAGGPALRDSSGHVWAADGGFTGGIAAVVSTPIAGTDHPEIYQSERFSASPFAYQVAVPNGDYSVTLKFAELHYGAPGGRLFNVSINGRPVLTSFDPANVAGASFTALDRQFRASASNGRLSIEFQPVLGEATISGIEIAPAAAPIRIRAGVSAFTSPDGIEWSVDASQSAGSTLTTQAPIAGTTTPELYQAAHSDPAGFEYDMTAPDGDYLVRLKFAEIVYTGPGQRQFDVSINGRTVLTHFDVAQAAGGGLIAVDRQFLASAKDGNLAIRFEPYLDAPLVSAIEILPTVAVRVKCGDSGYTDSAGDFWSGDYNYAGGNSMVTTAPASADQNQYRTGRGGSQPFEYRFAVAEGSYNVTLNYTQPFGLLVNGQSVTPNPDASALTWTIPVTSVNGEIALRVVPASPQASINGIQILQVQ